MRRPRILWLKSVIPYPLDQGMNFTTNHLFRLLHQDFDIEYLCLIDGDGDRWKLEALQQLARISTIQRPNRRSFGHRLLYAGLFKLRQFWSYTPGEVFYEVPSILRAALQEKLSTRDYDLLFMEYWYFSELGDWLKEFNVAAFLIDNEMDRIESEIQAIEPGKRKILVKKADYVFRSHIALMRRARNVFFISAEDRQSFLQRTGLAFPNAKVFPYYYEFGSLPAVERRKDTLIFAGKMSYLPNILAARRLAMGIWPMVRAKFPEARLLLAGGHPTADVKKLAEIPGVEVTGYVDDLRALVASAAIFVAPIEIGGGLKIKLIEAAELESAIVATRFAFKGFEVDPGRDFVPAESDADFVEGILRLLDNPQERATLGKNARASVFKQFSSDAVRAKVVELFHDLATRRPAGDRTTARCALPS